VKTVSISFWAERFWGLRYANNFSVGAIPARQGIIPTFNHRIEWLLQMIDRMVDRDLQAKIVEARKLHRRDMTIFFQGFPDGGNRKEGHGAKIEIIADAPLVIIEWMEDLAAFVFIIEIRVDQACFCGLSFL
jgi:hypothetical protein